MSWSRGVVAIGPLVIVLLASLSELPLLGAQTLQTLTRQTINEAIDLGMLHKPVPYALRHIGKPDNPVVVGSVYTPFVRVALLSHAHMLAGRGRLEIDDIEPRWLEPVVYVAFRWYCCEARDMDRSRWNPFVIPDNAVIGLGPLKGSGFRRLTPPLWVKRGSDLLRQFGETPPYDDIAAVAAFPIDVLRTGQRFTIYPEFEPEPRSADVRTAEIRSNEADKWR